MLAALLVGGAPAPARTAPPEEAPVRAAAQEWANRSDGRSPLAVYALVAPREQARSGLIARVVLPAGVGCPALETQRGGPGGQPWQAVPMQERRAAASTQRAFDSLLVCEAAMPERAQAARIAGRRLPAALPERIEKLVVFGDTGCRILGSDIQSCNEASAWPLAQVARALVREQADVAIYLGDFYYREAPCPSANNSQCGGSPAPLGGAPFTDSGWGWLADVLVPMGPLLETLPLVMVRGNHEQCNRGGNGYFLLFDPAFNSAQRCAPSAAGTAPVVDVSSTAVDLPLRGGRSLRLVNVDSANGSDATIDAAIAARQRLLFAQAQRLARGAEEAWLLTHRPVNAVVSSAYLPNPPGETAPWASLTQTAASYGLLEPFQLMLSSHLHSAQVVQVPGQPGQIVLGNGGTELDPPAYPLPAYGPLATATGQPIQPGLTPLPRATLVQAWLRFGYMLAEPEPGPIRGRWRFTLKDAEGGSFARCSLSQRQVSCRDQPGRDG
ncbi:MAG: metallophosphoesterase [Synechococcaceae cyanobacterium]|nr:metallophosphoesterase [Synechococcaceae cyanobacterium]